VEQFHFEKLNGRKALVTNGSIYSFMMIGDTVRVSSCESLQQEFWGLLFGGPFTNEPPGWRGLTYIVQLAILIGRPLEQGRKSVKTRGQAEGRPGLWLAYGRM